MRGYPGNIGIRYIPNTDMPHSSKYSCFVASKTTSCTRSFFTGNYIVDNRGKTTRSSSVFTSAFFFLPIKQ